MTLSAEIESNIINLLSGVTETDIPALEPKAIDSLVKNLEASDNPESIQRAWLPILEIVNKKYWFKKWDKTRNDRPTISSLLNACKKSLFMPSNKQSKRALAEQIAMLHVVYSNLFQVQLPGRGIMYASFNETMNEARDFIDIHNLFDTEAFNLWNVLKASAALKKCNEITEDVKHTRASIEKLRNHNIDSNDVTNMAALDSEIASCNRSIETCDQQYKNSLNEGLIAIELAAGHKMISSALDISSIYNELHKLKRTEDEVASIFNTEPSKQLKLKM